MEEETNVAATYVPRQRLTFGEAMRETRAAGATYKGIWSWLTTVDHKRIGVMYGVSAFIFFLIGGVEALLIRIQLAAPDQSFLNPDQYNRIFTMHGTTMVFLVVMPLSNAFFNLMVPLMIGARDVAFPRLNAFSFWVFLAGGIFLNLSFFTGGNIFHGAMSLDQMFWSRPLPDCGSYATPIPGLYLCGSGAHPGGGVMGAPGYNAAHRILRDLRK